MVNCYVKTDGFSVEPKGWLSRLLVKSGIFRFEIKLHWSQPLTATVR